MNHISRNKLAMVLSQICGYFKGTVEDVYKAYYLLITQFWWTHKGRDEQKHKPWGPFEYLQIQYE